MDQTEVARYRALLRDQSQAKPGKLRPLTRWLGGDRGRPVDPSHVEPSAPPSSAPARPLAPAVVAPDVAPLDGPPTFPPRKPLPPLDPAPSGASASRSPPPSEYGAWTAPAVEAVVAPIASAPIAVEVERAAEASPVVRGSAPELPPAEVVDTSLRLDPTTDFVEPPPLGILDLLPPEMIAKFELERPASAPPRAFGRRDGDVPAAEVDVENQDVGKASASVSTPVGEGGREADGGGPLPGPELVAAEIEPIAEVTCVETEVAEFEELPDVEPGFGPLRPSGPPPPEGKETAALVSSPSGGGEREADGGDRHGRSDEPVAFEVVVVPIASATCARPPMIRRLEPESTPTAVMRNLHTILEAEQSIIELWRSMGRAAA